MVSPLRPVIANLFMEEFETRALSSFHNQPSIWLRFVDDTFVTHKAEHAQQFLAHLNSLDPNIQFTLESPDQQGCLPFLDILTSQGPDGTLITQSTGSQHIQTNIYIGRVTTALSTNTAYTTSSHTGCNNVYSNQQFIKTVKPTHSNSTP